MLVSIRNRMIITAEVMCMGVYGAYKGIISPAANKTAGLKNEKYAAEALAADITPLLTEAEKLRGEDNALKLNIENIQKTDGGKTATNEEFLVFLGAAAKENGVDVSNFNNLGTSEMNGIYKTIFDFELCGGSTSIINTIREIDEMGIKCSVGSFSYRQKEQYDYLMRYFDDLSRLPWYVEPSMSPVPSSVPSPSPSPLPSPAPGQSASPSSEPANTPLPVTPAPQITAEPHNNTEDRKENINDRLNSLLGQLTYTHDNYTLKPLLNEAEGIGRTSRNMRLNVTVCLIMFNPPSYENSILKTEGEL